MAPNGYKLARATSAPDHEMVPSALSRPPKGESHWSSAAVADRVGVSATTVLRVWRDHKLQPHRARGFKFSSDPDLTDKVTDVVGLYLHPPEKAVPDRGIALENAGCRPP